MRRDEFMKELEYLLQDIPDEDKADAIAYYQDYLEEAGPEKEEEVIRDFGSPERVAAIIRADIYGNLEDGGGFTETGYEDERFREPNFQLVKRQDVPEEKNRQETENGYGTNNHQETGNRRGTNNRQEAENRQGTNNHQETRNSNASRNNDSAGAAGSSSSASGHSYGAGMGSGYHSGYQTGNPQTESGYGSGMAPMKPERARWEWWQILGLILLGCCIIPVLIPMFLGVGGGALGLIFGLGGVAIAVLATLSLGLAAVTLVLLLGGILLVILCFSQLGSGLVQGVLCLGTGVGLFGLGLLGLSLCGLYYGIFLPWLVKSIIALIRRMIRGKGGAK